MDVVRFSLVRFLSFGVFIFLLNFSQDLVAQQLKVSGIVKATFDEEIEPLRDVNVYLKGTTTGTTTDNKGKFIFPKKLSEGDILIFSYLGFKKQEITITKKSTYLNILLKEDSNQMLGALQTGKRFKSKRPKQ